MKALLLVVTCVSLLVAEPARAAGAARGAARVAVSKGPGAERCMGEDALRRAVEARLRRAAFRRDLPVTLEVRIVFERTAAGWAADLTMLDGSGQLLGRRSIVTEAAHCSAMDDSLALVVALLVDSPPSAEAQPPPSAPPAPAAEPEQPAPAAPPVLSNVHPPAPAPLSTLSLPSDTAAPREPWRFDVSFAGVAGVGTLPGLALGGELGVGAKAPHVPELRVFADWFGRRDQPRADGTSGAHFQLASIGLELCGLDVHLGALRWFGCGGQSLGRLTVTAYGFDQNTTNDRLTYALLARTGLRFPLAGPFDARLGLRAELPLSRAIFDYGSRDGSERALYEMKPVTAALDLGLIVQL